MSCVLVVEDNDRNLKLFRDLLGARGHTVLEAGTAHLGLQLARDHLPDLILMDIRLPDLDGVTALAMLRKDPATARIPVMAVSASVMPDDQRRVASAGFDDFVAKPIGVRAFLASVDQLLPPPAPPSS